MHKPDPFQHAAEGPKRRSEVESRLVEDKERFLAFAFAGADLLLETTADGRIGFAAGAFRSRFGQEPESLIGKPASTLVAPGDLAAFTTCLVLLAAQGRIAPTSLRLADAGRTQYIVSGMARQGSVGETLLCLTFGMPANPPPSGEAALSSSAVFGREAERLLRSARNGTSGQSPTLDLLEVFSADAPIPQADITAALLDQIGAGSTAGELAPGRFGLLRDPSVSDAPELADVIAGLQKALGACGANVRVTATERLALGGEQGSGSAQQAVRALRYALSAFSRGGASALGGFENGLAGFVEAAALRTATFRRAIADRRFKLVFQPIVRLKDRTIHHYEALLRPEEGRGIQATCAGDFVSMVELCGLSEDLDWAVFEAARGAALRSSVAVAFNMSGLSVQSAAFRARLLSVLAKSRSGLAPRLLAEVTETAEIEDEDAAAETIEAIRQRGVPVCIDDFGAGAAAFRYLRRFQVDHVKIDGSYVCQAADNERDRGFVAAMIGLSRTVGASTIAEQIETEAVAEVMLALGVDCGQGWLFGRPKDLPTIPGASARRGHVTETWG